MIVYINALNVHQGGGLVLLKSLIQSFDKNKRYILILDSRSINNLNIRKANIEARYVKRSIFHRFYYELWFWLNVNNKDKFLSITNIPPIFRLKGKTFLYVHNRYLVEKKLVTQGNFFQDLRVFLERWLLRFFSRNIDYFFVQTNTMKEFLADCIPRFSNVNVKPFFSDFELSRKDSKGLELNAVSYDFLYVSSGELHKNHLKLFEAWKKLAKENIYPSLCVTLDPQKNKKLCKLINSLKADGMNIFNVGVIERKKIGDLYSSSLAFIYPSKMESFGIPLLEASLRKIPILAAELDFVRDLVDPVEVFDPNSSRSIARAVKRFLKLESTRPQILRADDFLKEIVQE